MFNWRTICLKSINHHGSSSVLIGFLQWNNGPSVNCCLTAYWHLPKQTTMIVSITQIAEDTRQEKRQHFTQSSTPSLIIRLYVCVDTKRNKEEEVIIKSQSVKRTPLMLMDLCCVLNEDISTWLITSLPSRRNCNEIHSRFSFCLFIFLLVESHLTCRVLSTYLSNVQHWPNRLLLLLHKSVQKF